jgi:hypothetical protein
MSCFWQSELVSFDGLAAMNNIYYKRGRYPLLPPPFLRSLLPSLSDLCCDANVLRPKQDGEVLIH